jgi:hypothetical protein
MIIKQKINKIKSSKNFSGKSYLSMMFFKDRLISFEIFEDLWGGFELERIGGL